MSHHVWAVALPGHDPLRASSASYAIFHAHRDRIQALGLEALTRALEVTCWNKEKHASPYQLQL